MADFKKALALTLPHEGGFANVEKDNGGMTYKGISRRFYPNWKGWAIIDAHLPLKWNTTIADPVLDGYVEDFYFTEKWRKLGGITYQPIANQIFDFIVNSGKGAKIVQRCAGVKDDGIIGNMTIDAINRAGVALNDEIKAARIKYLHGLVENDPSQRKFLAGWLERANRY